MLRKRSRPAVNASSNATTTTSIIISGGNSTTPTTVFPHPEKTSKPTLPSSLLFFNPSSSTIMSSLKDSNQSVVSPSSVLDSVSSSSSRLLDKRFFFSNPFVTSFTENKQSTQPQQQHPHSWDKSGISVALIDSSSSFLKPNHTSNSTTPWASTNNSSKLVVFGSHQLRIQIPSSSQPTSQLLNPNSPVEFGIKTPRSNLTPNFDKRTTGMEKDSPNQMRKSFSMEEMELSEDYTCVISRGPNPKTTHIFGNRVVECSSCGGGSRSRVWEMKRDEFGLEQEGGSGCLDCVVSSSFSSEEEECCHEDLGGVRSGGEGGSFLSHCCLCKKTLGDENVDIYMYRGEKAFCSQECRDQGMLLFDGNQS